MAACFGHERTVGEEAIVQLSEVNLTPFMPSRFGLDLLRGSQRLDTDD